LTNKELLFLTFCRSCGHLTRLRTLGTILGTTLLTVIHTGCIQCPANDVVTYTRKVFYPAASDQYDRVLLQVMTFARDIGVNLLLVG